MVKYVELTDEELAVVDFDNVHDYLPGLTETEARARFSTMPGVSSGLTGDGTNGLGSSSSEPGKGVCVH